MSLLCLMDLHIPEQGWLAYHYTQPGRWTYFGWTQWQRFESSSTHHLWDTPQHFLKTHLCLESGFLLFIELQKSLLVSFQGYWTQWQRFESSRIHLFRDTQQHFIKTYFCLESGFISFLELQSSLLVRFEEAKHNCKGLKALAFTVSENPTAFYQNTFLLRKWLPFIPGATDIPTIKFSGVLNTMAKVWKL